MNESTVIRNKIIEAARKRFNVYGFFKTTMAEIAGDCGMSASNIYRYFENKEEVGTAIALQSYRALESMLDAIALRDDIPASEKLEAFAVTTLRFILDTLENNPRMMELAEHLSSGRTRVVEHHIKMSQDVVCKILAYGVGRGEFKVGEIPKIAETIRAALIKFTVPPVVIIEKRYFAKEEQERSARDVVALIVNGLAKD